MGCADMRFARRFFASLQNDGMGRGMAAQGRPGEARVRRSPFDPFDKLRCRLQGMLSSLRFAPMPLTGQALDKLRRSCWDDEGAVRVMTRIVTTKRWDAQAGPNDYTGPRPYGAWA